MNQVHKGCCIALKIFSKLEMILSPVQYSTFTHANRAAFMTKVVFKGTVINHSQTNLVHLSENQGTSNCVRNIFIYEVLKEILCDSLFKIQISTVDRTLKGCYHIFISISLKFNLLNFVSPHIVSAPFLAYIKIECVSSDVMVVI